jgi:mono/diheme cytochrome c family protein
MPRAVTFVIAVFLGASPVHAKQGDEGWMSEWEVEEGFRLDADAVGFELPTSIAFVPEPGNAPGAPSYFVSELKGTIKVVTNDHKVHVFARGLTRIHPDSLFPHPEMPQGFAEEGVTGLCLAPEQGYVFATFNYLDSNGVLRNNVTRFSSAPGVFATEPSSQVSFTDIFARDHSANSHMIGTCRVHGNALYVGVGDAIEAGLSQFLGSTQGKVVRMSLDGDPLPDNPYYVDGSHSNAANYVFARGFRNPFGLEIVGDQVFVSENGINIDRFMKIEAGENFLWNGEDWSIGARSDMLFSPAVSPTATQFYPAQSTMFPAAFRGRFYVALSGHPADLGPSTSGRRSIVSFGYDFDRHELTDVPHQIVRYRGSGNQSVVAMAFGPDALYFAPLLPDANGLTPIVRLSWAPDAPHPLRLGAQADAGTLLGDKQCIGCHTISGRGGIAGPDLTPAQLMPRLLKRLGSNEYVALVERLDQDETAPLVSYRDARAKVLAAQGVERVRTWIRYRLIDPRFDNPNATMPDPGLSDAEAGILADYLTREIPTPSKEHTLRELLFEGLLGSRKVVLAVGVLLGLTVVPGVTWIRRLANGSSRSRRDPDSTGPGGA